MKRFLIPLFVLGSSFVHGEEEAAPQEIVAEEILEESLIASLDTIAEESLIAAAGNLGPTAAGYPADRDFGPESENIIDQRVLRDFIESRGLINCRQKEGTLTLASDVRARWVATGENVNGVKVRGQGTDTAINRFKSEDNVFLDYVASKGWVSTKLRFSAFDGVDGGTSVKTDLDRAFIGYDVFCCGEEDFYVEIGRSRLEYIFESRLEFSSLYDGIHFFYTKPFSRVGDFTIHGGPFIVDSFTNHYAWAIEVFIKKWAGTPFGLKYSVIDWFRHAPTLDYGNRKNSGDRLVRNNPRYRFVVSQMLFTYEKNKINFLGCTYLYAYAAVLVNHKAERSRTTANKYWNHGAYIGFTLGKLCKKCDWSLDLIYQYVEPQAVPEFDLAGIGHGNALDRLLSDAILHDLPAFDGQGFTNFHGPGALFMYALTDSLTLRAKTEWTWPVTTEVGGRFRYKTFEGSVIYAF